MEANYEYKLPKAESGTANTPEGGAGSQRTFSPQSTRSVPAPNNSKPCYVDADTLETVHRGGCGECKDTLEAIRGTLFAALEMKEESLGNPDDVRIIFWFDN